MSDHDERNTHFCKKCQCTKSVSKFPFDKRDMRYRSPCSDCKSDSDRARRIRLRAERNAPPRRVIEDHIAELRECIRRGMTADETAKKLGFGLSTLHRARRRHQLPHFRLPDVPRANLVWDEARLRRLKKLVYRMSYSKIAARLNTSRDAISGAIHRHGSKLNALAG